MYDLIGFLRHVYRTKRLFQAHPNVFPPSLIPQHYSVQTFHVMGSLILSRSFSVEKASKEHDDPTKMDVDIEGPESNEELGPEAEDSDSDGDSTEGPDSQIAMVPVADLLNARFGSENVCGTYGNSMVSFLMVPLVKAILSRPRPKNDFDQAYSPGRPDCISFAHCSWMLFVDTLKVEHVR